LNCSFGAPGECAKTAIDFEVKILARLRLILIFRPVKGKISKRDFKLRIPVKNSDRFCKFSINLKKIGRILPEAIAFFRASQLKQLERFYEVVSKLLNQVRTKFVLKVDTEPGFND
jgi:hypothetical protein